METFEEFQDHTSMGCYQLLIMLDERILTATPATAALTRRSSTGLLRGCVLLSPALGRLSSQLSCGRPITACFRGGPSWASPKHAAPLFLLCEGELTDAGDGGASCIFGDNNACESFPRSKVLSYKALLWVKEASLLGELLVDDGLLTSRSPRMRRGESMAAIETSRKRISCKA